MQFLSDTVLLPIEASKMPFIRLLSASTQSPALPTEGRGQQCAIFLGLLSHSAASGDYMPGGPPT